MISFEYQKNQRFFAQVAGGLEELGAEEIRDLGATEIAAAYRGLYFSADQPALTRIVYAARLLTRVLAPLSRFKCHSTKYLYKKALEIPWPELFPVRNSFAIFSSVSNSQIRHSQYAALVVKDAIVDSFRRETGSRPSVERIDPDIWFNVYIENNRATISLDLSGGSLHRRGYRQQAGPAPMQETVAAAILRMSAWQGESSIYDPMCGSGTLLCEALMAACNIPAAFLRRHFGFEYLPDFDAPVWQKTRERVDAQIKACPEGLIAGSDKDPDMIKACRTNLSALPYGEQVCCRAVDFRDLDGLPDKTIISNPPYGLRMQDKNQVKNLYRQIGDFLKQKCPGSTAFLYLGDRTLVPFIGLRPSWRKPLKSGALDGRLIKIEIYK